MKNVSLPENSLRPENLRRKFHAMYIANFRHLINDRFTSPEAFARREGTIFQ